MAANRQQGSYLAVFILAFTALVAGLVALTNQHAGIGVVVVLAGIALFVYSLAGFYRIKRLEYIDEG